MTPRHEIPYDSGSEPSEADERRIAALEDGSGFSHHMAEVAITGYDPNRIPPQRLADDYLRTPHSSRYVSRRGGRGYPEVPDSVSDEHWNTKSAPLAPDAAERLIEHTQTIRDGLQATERAKVGSADHKERARILAVQRARAERRSR